MPELILYGGAELLDRLLELLQEVWGGKGRWWGIVRTQKLFPSQKRVTLSTATIGGASAS